MKTLKNIIALLAILSFASYANARDQIKIVGSSTVYPYATVVAEQFGKKGSFKTPVIESTGTGGGMKLFCAGIGVNHPDITNASRAIKPKEKALCEKNKKITITTKSENKNFLVTIKDQGIGISKENIPQVTERFFRVDPAKSKEVGGTGLGLAIVKHIVNQHRAEMTISSEINKGTEISLNFPTI